jgi:hypothetical protein
MKNKPQENTGSLGVTLHYNAVVRLDHHEASIIHFNKQPSNGDAAGPVDPSHYLHIRDGNNQGCGPLETAFFRDIAKACEKADAILLVGSPATKVEFMAYLREHAPQTAGRTAEVDAAPVSCASEVQPFN